MSYADEIKALLAKKEALKRQKQYGYYGPPQNASPVPWISQEDWEKATRELEAKRVPPGPGQVSVTSPPGSIQNIAQQTQQKKAGWGWAFLIIGGGIFVFWGIPLLQGKGGFKPGMSKPPGYTPTRASPGESVGE